MYSIKEVSELLGVSRKTVYNAIKKAEKKGVTYIVKNDVNGNKKVTEQGYSYLSEVYSKNSEFKNNSDSNDKSLVNQLLEQLRSKDIQLSEKDKQIQEKDSQISQLIEQSRNYQVLLKSEQDKILMLAEKKPKFLSRFFKKNDN